MPPPLLLGCSVCRSRRSCCLRLHLRLLQMAVFTGMTRSSSTCLLLLIPWQLSGQSGIHAIALAAPRQKKTRRSRTGLPCRGAPRPPWKWECAPWKGPLSALAARHHTCSLACRLVLLRACVQNSAGGACAGGRWGWRWQYCRLRLRLRLRTRLTNAPGWHQELAAGGTWRTGMGRVMPYVTPRCRGFRGSALGSLRGT